MHFCPLFLSDLTSLTPEAKKEPLLLSIEYLDNGGLMGVEGGGQSVTMESFS